MDGKPTVGEISTLLNTIFGTHIDWTRLDRDELVEMCTVLQHPDIFLEKLGVNKKDLERGKTIGQITDSITTLAGDVASGWDGPIAKLARRVLSSDPKKGSAVGEDLKEASKS